MENRDRQLEEQIREMVDRQLGSHVQDVIRTMERGRWVHFVASVATFASAVVAAVALLAGVYTYFESTKREANLAASEALMRHFEYADEHGVAVGGEGSEFDSVATHGIYTANTIVDLTEGTDERDAWNSTVLTLLGTYEGFLSRENLPCEELDGEFEELVKDHFRVRCEENRATSLSTSD